MHGQPLLWLLLHACRAPHLRKTFNHTADVPHHLLRRRNDLFLLSRFNEFENIILAVPPMAPVQGLLACIAAEVGDVALVDVADFDDLRVAVRLLRVRVALLEAETFPRSPGRGTSRAEPRC